MLPLGVYLLPLLCLSAQAGNILVFLPLTTWSHYMQYELLYETLAERGHTLTIYSPYTPKQNLTNINHKYIISKVFDDHLQEFDPFKELHDKKWFLLEAYESYNMSKRVNRDILTHETFHQLIKSQQSFDLIMIDPFFRQYAVIFLGHIFKAPVVSMGAVGAHSSMVEPMGSPNDISYMPEIYSYLSDKMTFLERIQNLHYATVRYIFRRVKDWTADNMVAEVLGPGYPTADSLFRKISISFLYSVQAVEYPRALTPNMVQVGGIHMQRIWKKNVTLPEKLKKTLDAAKEGFILFSLGSVITPRTMPPSVGRTLMSAFSQFGKYKIIWKWNGEPLTGLPSNVLQLKWLPQTAVLAHPNCKLFITHGGLSSQLETVYYGIPVVTIPFFADQFYSATRAERFGFGVTLKNTNLTVESLVWALGEVLTNPRYKQKAVERSLIMKATFKSPLDVAVYWTEYLIQHKGAAHLSPMSRQLYWYQYYLLDIFAFFISVIVGFVIIVKKLVRTLLKKEISGRKTKNKLE